jgi:hypothetical protein
VTSYHAPPAHTVRQGVAAEVPIDSVVRAVVPRTTWLVRGGHRGPNWFPIPFIYLIDIVGLAAIGAAFAIVALGALVLSMGRTILAGSRPQRRLPVLRQITGPAVSALTRTPVTGNAA